MKPKSKDNSRVLMNALVGMNEYVERERKKQETKLWSEVDGPLTLRYFLSKLTKDELTAIRKRLLINNVSSLKKDELLAIIPNHILANVYFFLLQMNEQQYKLILTLAERNGIMKAPKLNMNQLRYLREIGFVFTGTHKGKNVIMMPIEVVNQVNEMKNNEHIKTIVKRNTELITLTQGLLYYYGTLSFNTLVEMIEKYTKQPVHGLDFKIVIESAAAYYKTIAARNSSYAHFTVSDSGRLIEEQLERADLTFYPFTKAQLLKAGKPGYVEKNDSYQQMVNFLLQHYQTNQAAAEQLVEKCEFAFKKGDCFDDVMGYLRTRIELTDVNLQQLVIEKVTYLMNNTRSWYLKGYTRAELKLLE